MIRRVRKGESKISLTIKRPNGDYHFRSDLTITVGRLLRLRGPDVAVCNILGGQYDIDNRIVDQRSTPDFARGLTFYDDGRYSSSGAIPITLSSALGIGSRPLCLSTFPRLIKVHFIGQGIQKFVPADPYPLAVLQHVNPDLGQRLAS